MTTLIKTCRSERKAEDYQQVVSTTDQLLAPSPSLSQLSSCFAAICHNYYYVFMTEARLPWARTIDSNSSINYFHFPMFSVIWGICFSLKANPNGTKNIAFWHTFGTGDAPALRSSSRSKRSKDRDNRSSLLAWYEYVGATYRPPA